ncbi:hypothetical protein Dimus_021382 [Dionaea muscipula]
MEIPTCMELVSLLPALETPVATRVEMPTCMELVACVHGLPVRRPGRMPHARCHGGCSPGPRCPPRVAAHLGFAARQGVACSLMAVTRCLGRWPPAGLSLYDVLAADREMLAGTSWPYKACWLLGLRGRAWSVGRI